MSKLCRFLLSVVPVRKDVEVVGVVNPPLNRPHESVELDDLKLLAIHRDLRSTPRLWPDDAILQTAIGRFSYS